MQQCLFNLQRLAILADVILNFIFLMFYYLLFYYSPTSLQTILGRLFLVGRLLFNKTSTLVGYFVSLPEKGRREIEEILEEIKERDRV